MPLSPPQDSLLQQPPSSVLVSLSGGVDSAVAAFLLKEWGWDVHALHFLFPAPPHIQESRLGQARRVAEVLGIPFSVLNVQASFEERVVEPFVSQYLKGLTPNPCVLCNPLIKFHHLERLAREKGLDYMATGHYARVVPEAARGLFSLRRGADRNKDQSYFLHRLNPSVLASMVFPLGPMTKEQVRGLAMDRGLVARASPESQEICFLAGRDYRRFLEERTGNTGKAGGAIVDWEGNPLGEHQGVYRFTIGQRSGLGIASSRPYYVKEIEPEHRRIFVARKEELYSRTALACQWHWTGPSWPPLKRIPCVAQVRYRNKASPGCLEVLEQNQVSFTFDEPQWAITPGQALVCYEGDRVLGGGWIMRAR